MDLPRGIVYNTCSVGRGAEAREPRDGPARPLQGAIMQRRRKAIAALGLAACVFVAAGNGSFYMCVGTDGHTGLDVGTDPCECCCTDDPSAAPGRDRRPSDERSPAVADAHGCDCTDTPIAFEAAGGPAKSRRLKLFSAFVAALGEREVPSAGPDTLADGPPARPPPLAGSGLPSLRTIVLLI